MTLLFLRPTESSFLQLQKAAARPPTSARSRTRSSAVPESAALVLLLCTGLPGTKDQNKKSPSFPYYSALLRLMAMLYLQISSVFRAARLEYPLPQQPYDNSKSYTMQSCGSSGDAFASFRNQTSSKWNATVVPPCQTPQSEQTETHLLDSRD